MQEQSLALIVLAAAAAALWLWLAWRRSRAARGSAKDLVAVYRAGAADALVLMFTTPECVPCKTVQRPALDALERHYPGRVVVAEVDALREPRLAARFGVLTVPTTVVIGSNGVIRAINNGAATAQRLAAQAGLDRSRWESEGGLRGETR